jgi:transposase
VKKEDVKNVEMKPGAQQVPPDPEVDARPTRRRFEASYKQRILAEAAGCAHGELGGLLRREGLHSSHLETWRRQRDRGEIAGLTPRKRGRKPVERNPLQGELESVHRELERTQHRLKQAELIISVQKKVCQMLGQADQGNET